MDSFLDYFDYKDDAGEFLKEKYNFKPYEYKHYESIFTDFIRLYSLKELILIKNIALKHPYNYKSITRNDAIVVKIVCSSELI